MTPQDDPTGDLYKLMDEAGLNGGNLMDTKRSQARIINEIRTTLAAKLRDYIVSRDKVMFSQGAHSGKIKKIEVQDEE